MADNGNLETLFDLRKIYAIIRKNWLVLKADRSRLIMMLFFPLVMILIFGYTTGQSPEHIPTAIIDYDNSVTSHLIISEINSKELFSVTRVVGTQDEGKELLETGQAKILFIIPQGFENDIDAGRTATISVMVDESDPSIAQITEASTEAFIQQLSIQFTAQRISSMAQQMQAVSQYLADSGQSLGAPATSASESDMESIGTNYLDVKYTDAETDSMVSSTTQSLMNTLGEIYDPNVLIAEYENETMDPSAFYASMTGSDIQQPTLAQVAIYETMEGTADRMAIDTASMYASSKDLYAQSVSAVQMDALSANALDSAATQTGKIASAAQSIPQDAIEYNQIQPYGFGRPGLDFLLPSILALIVFQGASMGMGRAIAGERRDGSLTRVFLTPTSNTTIIAGTLSFYLIFETIRSSLIVLIAVLVFGVTITGSPLDIFVLIAIYAAGATGIGMVLSVLTRSQEQYQAAAAIITLPTMFLAGVFIPIETMPPALQAVTKILPITYAADALQGVMIKGFVLAQVVPDIIFLVVFAIITLALSVMLFKRELI
jgi:ABC transporter DrrB family efflux protein